MQLEEAINIIENRLLSESSIPMKIRTRQIVDDKEFLQLKEAVMFLIE